MADDDDKRDAVGPDELFAPSGPRRSNFTPPTNDAETLEAANNLFNDDAIAAALAAELAKVASGPIPIIRPQAVPAPQPAPPVSSEAEREPEPQPAPEPELEPQAVGEPEPQPGVAPEPVSVQPAEPAPVAAEPEVTEPEATEPEPVGWTSAAEPAQAAAASEELAEPTSFESPSYPSWAPTADASTTEPEHAPEESREARTEPEAAPDPRLEAQPEPEPEPEPEAIVPAPEQSAQSYFAPPPADFGTPISPDAPDLGTVWSLDDSDEIPASAAPAWGEPAAEIPSVPDPAQESAPEAIVAGSVASVPVASEPVASEPVASEPVASEPVASEPVASEPIASPAAVPPSPFAPEARDYYSVAPQVEEPSPAQPQLTEPESGASGPPLSEPAPPEPALYESALSEPDWNAPEPAAPEPTRPEPTAVPDYSANPYIQDAPRVPSPIFPGTPAGQFVPTSAPLSNPDEEQHPWPPAPEASSPPIDQPPPYLGAPAPTVPAADAPPPPGYEAPPFTPSVPHPTDDAPQPGSETLSAIQQLEAELERHQRAQEAPDESEPQPDAEAPVEPEVQPIDPFGGYTAPVTEPPTPTEESVQLAPPPPPAVAEPAADAPVDIPSEPSLAGTAFDSLFTAPAAVDPSPPESDTTASPFPGFGPPPSLSDEPLDIPAPGASLPPQEDHGVDAPIFLEPHANTEPPALVEPPPPAAPTGDPFAQDFGFVPPPTSAEEVPAVEPVDVPAPATSAAPEPLGFPAPPVADAPPPAASSAPAFDQPPPPFGFESLVTGDGDIPQAAPQPSTWLTPPSQDAPPPPYDARPVSVPAPEEAPAAAPAPVSAPWQDAPPPPPVDAPAASPYAAPAPVEVPPAPSDVEQPVPGLAFPVEQTAEAPPPPPPPAEEEPEGKRPFGEGVDRASAIGPGSALLATSFGLAAVTAEGPAATNTRQRVFTAELVGLEPSPLDYRVGRAARLFWLWFASNSSIVAVVFGGVIFALGLSLRQAIVATLAGVAVSFLPLGLGTLAGKRSGQPTMVVSRATFGVLGNVVPAVIALLTRVFWAGALIWILGAGSAGILVGARLGGTVSGPRLTLVFVLLSFVVALVVAYFGYALIARLQLVISIAATVLGAGFVVLTAHDIDFPVALSRGDGPWIVAVTGAVLVFSFVGLVWANSSSDLARYQRVGSSGATSMLWATFGAALPSFILISYGALLAASNPRLAARLASNPLDALGTLLPVWYPLPLLAATALSLVSGAVVAMYSAGFAVQAVGLRARRPVATLLIGLLVLVVAVILAFSTINFTQLFRDFATTAAVPVAAWAGMFGAEMMIRNRRFETNSLLRRGGVYADVRWPNLIALVVIAIVGLGLTTATVPWLSWEGYLFKATGVPATSDLASTDGGVFVALILGLLFPLVAGVPAIRRQERAERAAE
jgi:purine-cytosine permease-like protein